jgi:hypothetical protein
VDRPGDGVADPDQHGDAGTFRQRTELSQPHKAIFGRLKIAEPSRTLDVTPA